MMVKRLYKFMDMIGIGAPRVQLWIIARTLTTALMPLVDRAADGQIGLVSGGSVPSDPAIADGMVLWGSCHEHLNSPTGHQTANNDMFYAFALGDTL